MRRQGGGRFRRCELPYIRVAFAKHFFREVERALENPNRKYSAELARVSEMGRILEERESLMRNSGLSHAMEAVARADMSPEVRAAIEATRMLVEGPPLDQAMKLIRESSVISVQENFSVLRSETAREVAYLQVTASQLFGESAREIAAAARPHQLFGESAREIAAAALPMVSQLYGDTVRGIVAASLPSLEMSSALKAALSVARLDLREDYQQLASTALATAEIQALLASISLHETRGDWIHPLTNSLSALASASKDIWVALPQHDNTTHPALAGWLLEAPIIQTYEASRSIVQLARTDDEEVLDFGEAPAQFRAEAGVMGARLEKLGKRFLIPYRAAQDALTSKREDYMRQATTSLRELLDQLLLYLAPDSKVKTWPDSSQLLKGTPRKARLNFLFRHVLSGKYAIFVENDIELILQTFYALNKVVHSLEEPYSDSEVRILAARIDGNLLMLLEVAELEPLHGTA